MPQLRCLRVALSPILIAGAFAIVAGTGAASAQPPDDFAPVTDAMLQDPSDDDWLMWRRTLDGWGYSPPSTRSTAATWATCAWCGPAP